MPNMANLKTLAELTPGETARVVEIVAAPHLALSILEIGIVKGVNVLHLRTAPLGGPIQVEVEGFLLSLRRDEARAILVESNGKPGSEGWKR
ncbi:MAG: FeoA family protein [Candidatus Zixiibacteriota bacterium]